MLTKVLALGGAGVYGRLAARILVESDEVSEIAIAGRNLETAKLAAADLGDKASAVRVDARDEGRVAILAHDSDIVVNTAGPDYVVGLPALRAAIRAGVHYCDLNTDGRTTEMGLVLDGAAKGSDVTALVGIGEFPGLSGLMMLHAARQLDRAEELRYCLFYPLVFGGEPKSVLSRWQDSGHADASWQSIMRQAAGNVRVYRDGRWLDIDPLNNLARIALRGGGETTAILVGNSDPVTLPRVVREVRSVSALACFLPPSLNRLYCELGRRIARGELDESAAAISFYEHLAAQPEGWLGDLGAYESGFEDTAEAVGIKGGRRVRYQCWPSTPWTSTSVPLAVAALKILRGEVRARGVLPPVSCLDPMTFFAEVAQHGSEKPITTPLLSESLEPLD